MKSTILLLALIFVFFVCVKGSEYGVAILSGGSADPNIVGQVYFIPINASFVRVSVNISGITQNLGSQHGIHVHSFGDVFDPTGLTAGGHFAGVGTGIHGCFPNIVRDEGDMGNWDVSADGKIIQEKELDLLTLTGDNSIIGRAVVLHNNTDDCVTVPSSGARIARGVIGVGNPAYFPSSLGSLTLPNTAVNSGVKSGGIGVCYLTPNTGSIVSGKVFFGMVNGLLQVTAKVSGLTPNTAHGIHIHEFGDISTKDGNSVGGHYNPYNHSHGVPPAVNRHLGDLGSICAYEATGDAYYSYGNDLTSQINNMNNYIGRAVIVHSLPDNGSTIYGARIAQCVIGIANNVTIAPTSSVPSAKPDCGVPVILTTTGNTTSTSSTSTTGTGTTSSTTRTVTGASSTSGGSSIVLFNSVFVFGMLLYLLV